MDIKSLHLEQLKEELEKNGEKQFRAKQLYEWLHVKLARTYDEMTNIPSGLKQRLSEKYPLKNIKIEEVLISKVDGTRKYLFRLSDGNIVESVWMKYKHGNSVCISSQVGCRMGCKFCASTLDGLERSLLPSEMLDQIYAITLDTGERVSNIVIMGAGEPFDNFQHFLKFIQLISDENGLHISQRNITVSTCGIIPKIIELADKKLQITLAVSLHAPNNEKRKELMPIAAKYEIHDLIKACSYYFEKTGRRITIEYSLVNGVNDHLEEAVELCKLIKNLNCHVNLIPVNPIKERKFVESNYQQVINFKNKLEKSKINVTIRREMGRDINGACGQLRRSYIKEK